MKFAFPYLHTLDHYNFIILVSIYKLELIIVRQQY